MTYLLLIIGTLLLGVLGKLDSCLLVESSSNLHPKQNDSNKNSHIIFNSRVLLLSKFQLCWEHRYRDCCKESSGMANAVPILQHNSFVRSIFTDIASVTSLLD